MKNIIFLVLTALAVTSSKGQNWALDNTHSSVSFTITHMLVSETEGNFKKFSADVSTSKPDFTDLKVSFTIDVNSINTDDSKRDEHLTSEDFFNAKQFPTIKFASSQVILKGKSLTITGDLTMHGVTKKVKFTGSYNGTIKDPYGLNRAGFKLATTVKRSEFGLNWNKTLDQGGLVLSDEVGITVHIELTKK